MKKILSIIFLILLFSKPVFAKFYTYEEVYQYLVRTSENSRACLQLVKSESPEHARIYIDRWNSLMNQANSTLNGDKNMNRLLDIGMQFNEIMFELKTNIPDPDDPCNKYE